MQYFLFFSHYNIFKTSSVEKLHTQSNQALAPLAQVPNICLLLYGNELSYAVFFLILTPFQSIIVWPCTIYWLSYDSKVLHNFNISSVFLFIYFSQIGIHLILTT